MANNLILPFAQGAGANVLTDAAYNPDSQRTIGNQTGIARSQLVNKAMLQSSAVAAGVAQFLAAFQATDITDQLTPSQYSNIMVAALNASGVFTTQVPGDNTTRAATCAFVQTAVAAAINSGALVMFPGTSAPPGYIKANGATLSRVTYANLWAYAQASGNMAASDAAWTSGQFSPGDGSTTFRVPDLRGYHMRAWDDSRGVDAGRVIGSVQQDAFQNHSHGINDPGHAHSVYDPAHNHLWGHNNQNGTGFGGGNYGGVSGGYAEPTSSSTTGIGIYAASTSITIQSAGAANETRVKNLAMLACIKY